MSTENNYKPIKKSLLPIIIASGSIGILVGVVGVWIYKQYSGQITNVLLFLLLALFVFALLTFVLFWMLKNYLTRLAFGANAADAPDLIAEGQKLSKSLINYLIDNLPQNVYQGDRSLAKNLAHTLSNLLIWGRLRNWWWNWLMSIFVAIGGLAGTLLLVNQNELLQNQNNLVANQTELLSKQNKLIENQMSLEEASRRGSLVVLMSNIFDKVDDEIAAQRAEMIRRGKMVTDSTKFSISQSLIGQIAALGQAFKPYRFMDGDTLIKKPLSPERGQLLITICGLPLDTATLDKIFKDCPFSESDLRGAYLNGFYLSGAYLSDSDLSNCQLSESTLRNTFLTGTNLTDASFDNANLENAFLDGSDLRRTDLQRANLQNASFNGSNLEFISLSNTNLRNCLFIDANLKSADLDQCDLRGADFAGANLTFASLENAQLDSCDLSRAKLEVADLRGACLISTNLSNCDLKGANMSYADLTNAKLNKSKLDWVNFHSAKLSGVNFREVELIYNDFRYADLSGAINLSVKKLDNVLTLYKCFLPPGIDSDSLKRSRPLLFVKPKY